MYNDAQLEVQAKLQGAGASGPYLRKRQCQDKGGNVLKKKKMFDKAHFPLNESEDFIRNQYWNFEVSGTFSIIFYPLLLEKLEDFTT